MYIRHVHLAADLADTADKKYSAADRWVGSIESESPDTAGTRGFVGERKWGRGEGRGGASIVRNYMEKIPVRRRAFSLLS